MRLVCLTISHNSSPFFLCPSTIQILHPHFHRTLHRSRAFWQCQSFLDWQSPRPPHHRCCVVCQSSHLGVRTTCTITQNHHHQQTTPPPTTTTIRVLLLEIFFTQSNSVMGRIRGKERLLYTAYSNAKCLLIYVD